MDLMVHRYETFESLYRYCFHVASSVGLVCLQIFGFSDELAKKHAEHCGIAFQLTNILRDLKEDAGMGRIYLPAEDMKRFDYGAEDLQRGIVDERFRRLMTFETNRAQEYFDRARPLLQLIDKPSQPALWAMMEIYGRILQKIVRRGYDVFSSAINLSNPAKASIACKAITLRLIRGIQAR